MFDFCLDAVGLDVDFAAFPTCSFESPLASLGFFCGAELVDLDSLAFGLQRLFVIHHSCFVARCAQKSVVQAVPMAWNSTGLAARSCFLWLFYTSLHCA